MTQHADLPDAGRIPHFEIDAILEKLRPAPIEVTGERDTPEAALATLLTVLARLGLIVDSTTET